MAIPQSHPLTLAERWFADRGFGLTENAQRAVAIGLGLAGCVGDCDEAYLSIGLRASNSVLALLTDKYSLSFDQQDHEVSLNVDNREEEQVRRQLADFRLDFEIDPDDPTLDFPCDSNEGTAEKQFVGAEGEPDDAVLEEFLNEGTAAVLEQAIRHSRNNMRRFVDTSDLILGCADLPMTAAILDQAHVSDKVLLREIARYRSLEPFVDSQKLVLTFNSGRIAVRTFGLLDGYIYEDRQLGPQDVVVQLTNTPAFVTQSTLGEFEDLINWKGVSERDIHKFIVDHPELLLGDKYTRLHSELILDCGDEGKLVPDFFAELSTSPFSDLIDLKKPNEELVVGGKHRRGLSAAVNSALYQLRTYRDYFDGPRRRTEFYAKYGFHAFRPRIAVIIGRSPPYHEMPEYIEAARGAPDAEIITYDDLVARARRRLLTVAIG